jgi:hypothetical protein
VAGVPLPSPAVAVALASVAVHAEEALGSGGHKFDVTAIQGLLSQQDVQDYLARLDGLALLPVPR